MKRLTIDNLLPESFFRDIGKYVQCCAHIERLTWLVTCQLEGKDPTEQASLHEIMELRKTPGIETKLKRLEAAGVDAAQEIQTRIFGICNRIRDGAENRHMAVHGAWFCDPEGLLRVEYFKNLGSKSSPDWRHYDAPVSQEYIDFAVRDCNEILDELLSILDCIQEAD